MAFRNKEKQGLLKKIVNFALSAPAYMLSEKHRLTKFREFIAAHDYDTALKVVKSVDGHVPNLAFRIMCPKITYNKVIYIPRIKKTLSIDNLKETLDAFMSNDVLNSDTEDSYEDVRPIYSNRKLVTTKKKARSKYFSDSDNTPSSSKVNVEDSEYEEKTERLLKLRILSPVDLEIIDELDKLRFKPTRRILKVKAIIIHIHGGGFVTMSADQHQTYTRQW